MGTGGASSRPGNAVFYRFRDASGREHLVDSIDDVPQAQRAHAEHVSYAEESPSGLTLPQSFSPWQMFAVGVGAALLVTFLFRRLPGTMRGILKIAVLVGVAALIGGAYFGWVRRSAQQSSDLFASPSSVLDDAKGAVEKMNARLRAERAELKEAEQAK